jgi:hypothetical protein
MDSFAVGPRILMTQDFPNIRAFGYMVMCHKSLQTGRKCRFDLAETCCSFFLFFLWPRIENW